MKKSEAISKLYGKKELLDSNGFTNLDEFDIAISCIEENDKLKTENDELKSTIVTLNYENSELKAENEKLKEELEKDCETCAHSKCRNDQYPCNMCRNLYTSKYKLLEGKVKK